MRPALARPLALLRRAVFSAPAISLAALALAYVLGGFLLAPVVVKWQMQKQVEERLGHRISIGEVRINPLKFTAELKDIVLREPSGGALFGFGRLFADFEIASVRARVWTFAELSLERPVLNLERDAQGRFNIAALIEALRGPEPPEKRPPPRLRAARVSLSDGSVELKDRRLGEPLVGRIAPLAIELRSLSTLPGESTSYQASARTAEGETLELAGSVAIDPLQSKGKLAIAGLSLSALARALHEFVGGAAPAGRVDASAEFALAWNDGRLSGRLSALDVAATELAVTAPAEPSPLLALKELSVDGARVDLERREVRLPRAALRAGAVALRADAQGKGNWQALLPARAAAKKAQETREGARGNDWRVELEALEIADIAISFSTAGRSAELGLARATASATAGFGKDALRLALASPELALSAIALASGEDRLSLPALTVGGARLTLASAQSQLRLEIESPRASLPGLALRRGGNDVKLGELALEGGSLTLAAGTADLRFGFDAPLVRLKGIALEQDGRRADLGTLSFRGKRLSLLESPERSSVEVESPSLVLEQVAAREGRDALQLRSIALQAGSASIGQERGQSDSAGGTRAELKQAELAASGLVLGADHGRGDLARARDARAAAASIAVSTSAAGAEVVGEGMAVALAEVLVPDPRGAGQIARFGSAWMTGASLRLRDRALGADRIVLSDGAAQVTIDAAGKLNWSGLIPDEADSRGAKRGAAAPGPPAWHIAANSIELDNIDLGFSDQRRDPSLDLGLNAVQARLQGLDTGARKPARLAFRAAVRSGGSIEASGTLGVPGGEADLGIKVSDLALAPAQAFLAQAARLAIASGTLSAEGRLRYGDKTAGADLSYEGSASVAKLRLEESDTKRPFLGWEELAASDLSLRVAPGRLDVGELRLEGPSGRLIIAEDRSVNLAKVLRGGRGEAKARPGQAPDEDPFPVSLARLRVRGGALEFADQSLRPPFATRMHGLKGVVTGLGTDRAGRATLELEAQVDEFGLARIEGRINALRPREFTDVEMTFRNLDMSSLTPYTAKFAGYRIASGTLSLDLHYRIRDSGLQGENRIVLTKLELGEKVDSPSAIDLPLEMGIALLKDADGVIDIALPVSGNLADPKFDYGEIVSKAIGNLIGGIVSAPFRALAALFGAGSEELGTIEFAPGVSELAPPERQKLRTVAQALRIRPQLRLSVHPAFAQAADEAALKSEAARRAVVLRMGIRLAAGEAPGPVDVALPRAQRAVEAVFLERYSPAALDEAKAAMSKRPAPVEPTELHRVLLDRLIDEQPIEASVLQQLAQRRGAAIADELTRVAGVDAARISVAAPAAAEEPDARPVATRLELGAAR